MIKNEGQIRRFWQKLDPLQNDEVYMILGGARKKYAKDNPAISTSHEIISRQLVKENEFPLFLSAVRKTQALLNVSTDKNTGEIFPPESHVIYIGINPRSTVDAMIMTMNQFNIYYATLLKNSSDQGRQDAYKQLKRFNVHYFSSLQKSASNKKWRIIDIDVKDRMLLSDIVEMIGDGAIKFITETHGGYHIIYDRKANEYVIGQHRLMKIQEKWNLRTNQLETFKDRLTPIWGTEQGGFEVKEALI